MGTLLIKAGRVYDGVAERILEHAYVLVDGDAISMAAAALGRSTLGVIAPGKAADLLAVHGNPLQDIHALNAPRLVVSRGRIVV